MIYRFSLLLFITIAFLPIDIFSQQSNAKIYGTIKNFEGEYLPGINVFIKENNRGASSNVDGEFVIDKLKPGNYLLTISGIGFKTLEEKITLRKNQHYEINFTLEEATIKINEVVVKTNSVAEELKSKGYSISVIENTKHKNLTKDLNQVLKTTPGINIREAGGLGSGFNLSLNGLSGNQIRYFIDDIPMENFGSALSLNNFPINLIDKLEIYKGVVPISLGADALGGAINIVTDYWKKSFFDAAYSYGTFNTHRVSINSQYANWENNYYLKSSLFFNHSDNNYEMIGVPVYDLELGNYLGEKNIERFNNEYSSSMINIESGLFNQSFADKISLAFIYAANNKYFQHPDNNILRVFGDFQSKNESLLFFTTYRKQFESVKIKVYGIGGKITESVIDTSRKKYNWNGDFIQRKPDDPKGELFERRSFLEITDWIVRSNIGIDYNFSINHKFSLSGTQNYLKRLGNDKVDVLNRSYNSPNFIQKNLIGLAYSYIDNSKNLDITAFGKQYWYSGKIVTQNYDDEDVTTKPSLTKTGFGIAASYKLFENLQLKSSFEKAYRIPESFEILGDGIYINPNPLLQPETSHNINLGARYSNEIGDIELKSEVNLFYRFSKDFIRFNPLGPFGEFENLNNVRTEGIEGSILVKFKNRIQLNTNLTYQSLTDQTKFDEGLENDNYNDRVPNVPYFFGNIQFVCNLTNPNLENKLVLYYNIRYVHNFFLTWADLGNIDGKNIIPKQFTQDLQFEYSLEDGKYNLSLAVNNVFNKIVYDNFNIQKPGRSYSLKIRYFLN